VSRMPEVQIIVRTHPASSAKLPLDCARRWRIDCLVNPPAELLPLLKLAAVVVGQPTTALAEAMLVEKPVVFFNVMMSREMAWWLDHGDLASIDDAAELPSAIRAILTDPLRRSRMLENQKEFLAKLLGPVDGGASQRTVQLMKTMIREGSGRAHNGSSPEAQGT